MQNYLPIGLCTAAGERGSCCLQIKLIRRKKNLIVRLRGELDHHNAAVFREAVEQELDKGIVQNIVLNLADLTFMDSSGIGAILGRYRRVNASGGKMVFCEVSNHLKKVLQIGGVLTVIPVAGNENKALAGLNKP